MLFGIIPEHQSAYILGRATPIHVMRTDDLVNNTLTFNLRWSESGSTELDKELVAVIKIEGFYSMTAQEVESEIIKQLKEAVDNARNE